MNYRVIDKDKYYRRGVFRHFSEDCKCSTSMTARVDVTDLVKHSKRTGTRFYINAPLLHEKRTGHGNAMTKEEWQIG